MYDTVCAFLQIRICYRTGPNRQVLQSVLQSPYLINCNKLSSRSKRYGSAERGQGEVGVHKVLTERVKTMSIHLEKYHHEESADTAEGKQARLRLNSESDYEVFASWERD